MLKSINFLNKNNTLREWEIVANLGRSDLCNIEGKMSLYEWVSTNEIQISVR